MSRGLETGGSAAPDPGTRRAGSSQQLWIYAPSPQHLPLPLPRGKEHPHHLAPREQTAGGSPCQPQPPQQNTGPAPRRDGTGLGAGTQHPSSELGCSHQPPSTLLPKGHGCQAVIPPLLPPASPPHCCRVVPHTWGRPQRGCLEPTDPPASGCPEDAGVGVDGSQGGCVREWGVPNLGVWSGGVSGRAGCGLCPAPQA